ncbi:MAG TPA: trypsin-like peptidase domain-containing protein [Actinomycetota bacterium]|nr:trypsin-like peptidase domain-containing protein [Actinomycetota bacterium]
MTLTRAPRQPAAARALAIVSVVVGLAIALLLPGPAAAARLDAAPPSTPLEQVQALVQPAVVYEQITWTGYVYDETNKGYFTQDPFTVTFQCTGFVVNPTGYIATAGHCVDYDAQVRQAILAQVVDWAFENDYYEVQPSKETIATFADHWRIDGASTEGKADLSVAVAYGVSVSGEPTGKALPARVVGLRSFTQGDVALLKIEAKDLTVIPLSDNSNTGVGTEIVAIGYPAAVDLVTDANFNPSFKEGTISAEKTTDGGLLPVYEISAAVSGGMSGGPTVALNGDVIGVNSFRIEGESQPFNFVQPSQNLEELMRGEGVENTLGEVTDLYRAGLQAYFAGDRNPAIDRFEQVLQIVPSHQFAQEYLRKSQDLPEDSFLSSPLLWIVLVVGLLVVVGAVVLLIIASRRKKRPVVPGEVAPPPLPPTPDTSTPPPPPAAATPAQEATTVLPPPPPPMPEAPAEPETPAESPAEASAPEPEEAAEEDKFCPNCGKGHEADAHFCPRCGHRFD